MEYSARDGYKEKLMALKDKCELCGSKKSLEVHHIVPVYLGKTIGWPNSRIRLCENLITLCHKCHTRKTKRRYKWLQLPLLMPLSKLPRSG